MGLMVQVIWFQFSYVFVKNIEMKREENLWDFLLRWERKYIGSGLFWLLKSVHLLACVVQNILYLINKSIGF